MYRLKHICTKCWNPTQDFSGHFNSGLGCIGAMLVFECKRTFLLWVIHLSCIWCAQEINSTATKQDRSQRVTHPPLATTGMRNMWGDFPSPYFPYSLCAWFKAHILYQLTAGHHWPAWFKVHTNLQQDITGRQDVFRCLCKCRGNPSYFLSP